MDGLVEVDWKKFFETYGEHAVRLKLLGVDDSVTVNELFEMFVARMQEEK